MCCAASVLAFCACAKYATQPTNTRDAAKTTLRLLNATFSHLRRAAPDPNNSGAAALFAPAKLEAKSCLKAHLARSIGLVCDLPEAILVIRTRVVSKILRIPEDVRIAKLHGIGEIVGRSSYLQIFFLAEFKVLSDGKIQIVSAVGPDSRQYSARRTRREHIGRFGHARVVEPLVDRLLRACSAIAAYIWPLIEPRV